MFAIFNIQNIVLVKIKLEQLTNITKVQNGIPCETLKNVNTMTNKKSLDCSFYPYILYTTFNLVKLASIV